MATKTEKTVIELEFDKNGMLRIGEKFLPCVLQDIKVDDHVKMEENNVIKENGSDIMFGGYDDRKISLSFLVMNSFDVTSEIGYRTSLFDNKQNDIYRIIKTIQGKFNDGIVFNIKNDLINSFGISSVFLVSYSTSIKTGANKATISMDFLEKTSSRIPIKQDENQDSDIFYSYKDDAKDAIRKSEESKLSINEKNIIV